MFRFAIFVGYYFMLITLKRYSYTTVSLGTILPIFSQSCSFIAKIFNKHINSIFLKQISFIIKCIKCSWFTPRCHIFSLQFTFFSISFGWTVASTNLFAFRMCAQIVAHVVCGTGVAKEKKNLGDFIWKITLFLENVSVGFLAFYAISVLILGAKFGIFCS